METEASLPAGCVSLPSDLQARDHRTLGCDYDDGQFPTLKALNHPPDRITAMGVMEYLADPAAFLQALRGYGARVALTYCAVDQAPLFDRDGQGWRNHLTFRELEALFAATGFTLRGQRRLDGVQTLFDLAPPAAGASPRPVRSVCVLAYDNVDNFGDRLGWSLLAPLLPGGAIAERHTLRPFTADPNRAYDLVVVGTGNSLFGGLFSPQLEQLVRNARWALGVFGTQYRAMTDPAAAQRLIGALDLWFARYEDDRLLFGRQAETAHLGDWLIGAFPQRRWTEDGEKTIDRALSSNAALDRTIWEIQRWRAIRSPRLHPLLCALCSAERVAYREQREWPDKPDLISGKFGSMLLDVFGRRFEEDAWFAVDQPRVAAYRDHVAAQTARLRDAIATALAPGV